MQKTLVVAFAGTMAMLGILWGGGAINTAARLENVNKQLDTRVNVEKNQGIWCNTYTLLP